MTFFNYLLYLTDKFLYLFSDSWPGIYNCFKNCNIKKYIYKPQEPGSTSKLFVWERKILRKDNLMQLFYYFLWGFFTYFVYLDTYELLPSSKRNASLRNNNLLKPIISLLSFLKILDDFNPNLPNPFIWEKCGDNFIPLFNSVPYSHSCVHASLFKTILQDSQTVT